MKPRRILVVPNGKIYKLNLFNFNFYILMKKFIRVLFACRGKLKELNSLNYLKHVNFTTAVKNILIKARSAVKLH